jgi:DNA topoisomerase-1
VTVREGRFGPYVQLGESNGKRKPKTQSLLTGMSMESLDLETALRLLSLPRVLGQDEEGVDVVVAHGRFGAYIKRGSDTRSLEDESSLFSFTLDDALALLAQPKRSRRRRRSEPLKNLGTSEETGGAEIRLMEGPYGPYVTDGSTNASVPKGTDPHSVTLEQALDLIKERRARGPARKKKTAKRKPSARRKSKAKATKAKATKGKSARAKATGAKKAKASKKRAAKKSS